VANIKTPVVKLEIKHEPAKIKGRGKAKITAPALGQRLGVSR